MLTIRNAQLHAFGERARALFIEEHLAHVASDYPRHFARLGETGCRAFIEAAVAAGEPWRVHSGSALRLWIDLRLEYGQAFERIDASSRAWALQLLAHPALPDTVRLSAIWERFRERTGGRPLVPHE
ncbi:hypothetical protein [Duganella sp. S19_KUP01_CR8]|uniref:hypothetical protein n=1 Tax=Duganella sp. S19_KUP01_CR8 TaxID=3025502 RepID=UPI002FCDCD01